MQRMPGQRRQGECRQHEKGEEEPARLSDQLEHPARGEARKETTGARGKIPIGQRRIERGGGYVGDHGDGERHQQGKSAHQEPDSLHVEPGESVEPGQGEAEPQEGQPDRAGAQGAPEKRAQPATQGAGRNGAHECQPEKDSEHQRRDCAEPAAVLGSHDAAVGTPAAATVMRRS